MKEGLEKKMPRCHTVRSSISSVLALSLQYLVDQGFFCQLFLIHKV